MVFAGVRVWPRSRAKWWRAVVLLLVHISLFGWCIIFFSPLTQREVKKKKLRTHMAAERERSEDSGDGALSKLDVPEERNKKKGNV